MINLFYQYESKTFLDFIKDDIKNKDKPDENNKDSTDGMKRIKELEQKIKELTEEKVCFIFMTKNENIQCPITCKSSEPFSNAVKLFYKNYPELEHPKNYFKFKGSQISIDKTIEENEISNNSLITIYTRE